MFSLLSSSGISWVLQRVKAATQLHILLDHVPFKFNSMDWASLMSDLYAVIKASQHIPNIKALVRCSAPLAPLSAIRMTFQ